MTKLLVCVVGLLSVSACICLELYAPPVLHLGIGIDGYQSEGAVEADGRGRSVGDEWSHLSPSPVVDYSTADKTDKSYEYWREDVEVIEAMNVTYYVLTIQWTRILPTGALNNVNQAGIDYYNNIINSLLMCGIETVISLHRVEIPLPLSYLGGFTNDVIIEYFEGYADIVFGAFSDRVKWFVTFSEANVITNSIYGNGGLSPVIHTESTVNGRYLAAVNTLKSHAVAYRLFEAKYKPCFGGRVGIGLNSLWYLSTTNCSVLVDRANAFDIDMFANPLMSENGDFPDILKEQVASVSLAEGYRTSKLPVLDAVWIDIIKGAIDFLGLSYYTTRYVDCAADGQTLPPGSPFNPDAKLAYTVDPKWPMGTDSFTASYPKGLRNLLKYIDQKYGHKLISIIGNGWPDYGEYDDQDRIRYLRAHVREVIKAITHDNLNIYGYAPYSLLDLWEYNYGYTTPYGLVHVDCDCGEYTRRFKSSGYWYAQVAGSRVVP